MNFKIKIIADDRQTGRSSKLIEKIIKTSERRSCRMLVIAPNTVRAELLFSNLRATLSERAITNTTQHLKLLLDNGTEIEVSSSFGIGHNRKFDALFFDDLDWVPEDVFQTVVTYIEPSTEIIGVIETPHWLVQSLYQPKENVLVTTVGDFED